MATAMDKRARLHTLIDCLDERTIDALLAFIDASIDPLTRKLALARTERVPLSPAFARSLQEALADTSGAIPDEAIEL